MKDLKNILSVSLAIVVLLLYFYYSNKIMKMEQIQKQLSSFTENMQMDNDFYKLNLDIGNVMAGLKAPNIKVSRYRDADTLLSGTVKSGPILIFRYADINCNTCYESAIDELKTIFGDLIQHVSILCSYYAEKDFHVFKKINQIKFPIYRIESDAFDWAVEGYNTPYYFVLHPDMKISNVYIPSRSFPKMNKAYLESIKRLLVD
jgi:hypothetical protein